MPPKRAIKRSGTVNQTLLKSILQAIVDLRSSNGSTEKQIIRQIEAVLIASKQKSPVRDLSSGVKNCLRYAINQGVLVKKGGKYQLSVGLRSCRPIRKNVQKANAIAKKNVPKRTKSMPKGTKAGPRRRRAHPKEAAKAKKPIPKRKTRVQNVQKRKYKKKVRQVTPVPSVVYTDGNPSEISVTVKPSNAMPKPPTDTPSKTTKPKMNKRISKAKMNAPKNYLEEDAYYEMMDHADNVRCNNPNCLCNLQDRGSYCDEIDNRSDDMM